MLISGSFFIIHFLNSFFKLPTCLPPTNIPMLDLSAQSLPNKSSLTSGLFPPSNRRDPVNHISPLLNAAVAPHCSQARVPTRRLTACPPPPLVPPSSSHLAPSTSDFQFSECPASGPLHMLSLFPGMSFLPIFCRS